MQHSEPSPEPTPPPTADPAADETQAAAPAPLTAPPQPPQPNRLLRWLIAGSIMILGIGVGITLEYLKETPVRTQPVHLGPLVETISLQPRDVQVTVTGYGTVRPRAVVQLVPQVSGKVQVVAPALAVGGFFQAGETLLKIDPTDFELALQQAEAAILEAQAAVSVARASIAQAQAGLRDAQIEAQRLTRLVNEGAANQREKERADLQEEIASAQLAAAQAQLESAQAAQQTARTRRTQAELDLQRTQLSLPFTGRVLSKSVDVGQFIRAGEPIATAYDTSRAEVVVPLATNELQWFVIPTQTEAVENAGEPATPPAAGSAADHSQDGPSSHAHAVTLSANYAGEVHNWRGYISRMEGEIDAQSRMARVVIAVDHPFTYTEGPPLLPGLFVTVEIPGRIIENAVVIPRHAVHGGNEVWTVEDDRLIIRKVQIARTDIRWAYITAGLPAEASIITSQLDVVTHGMTVRTQETGENAPAAEETFQSETEPATDTAPQAPANTASGDKR